MVSTDPISDMLTRLRNAIAVNKTEVTLPYSKGKEAVAKVLQKNNFVHKVSSSKEGYMQSMTIVINESGKNPNITEITRVSKPGRRVYAKAQDIPKVKNGRGVMVVSTSMGLMTGGEAIKNKVGGELICKVY